MKVGRVFNIQRFSIDDGPGIRTTVFFKGCNLKCIWCHNPESIGMCKEVEFYPEKCIACMRCFEVCEHKVHYCDSEGIHRMDHERCIGCFRCVEECFAEALVGVGIDVSAEELVDKLLMDKQYYGTQGGVTFSGGESMLQIDFLKEVLELCKMNNIHTAVDTAGNFPWSHFEKILGLVDLFLYDIKASHPKRHKELTGVDNVQILSNLKKLNDRGEDIIIRIPYIYGINHEELEGIGNILKPFNSMQVELLGYHKLGNSKYQALRIDNSLESLPATSQEQLDEGVKILKDMGINVINEQLTHTRRDING